MGPKNVLNPKQKLPNIKCRQHLNFTFAKGPYTTVRPKKMIEIQSKNSRIFVGPFYLMLAREQPSMRSSVKQQKRKKGFLCD